MGLNNYQGGAALGIKDLLSAVSPVRLLFSPQSVARRMRAAVCTLRGRQWLLKPQIYSCVCTIMMSQTRGPTAPQTRTYVKNKLRVCVRSLAHSSTHAAGVQTKSRCEQWDVCQIHTTYLLAVTRAHTHTDKYNWRRSLCYHGDGKAQRFVTET